MDPTRPGHRLPEPVPDRRRRAARLGACAVALLAVAGCPSPSTPDVFATPGEILPLATAAQRATFKRGLAVATRRFGPKEGLGPDYNVTYCVACHEKPVFGGSSPRYRNFNLIADAGGAPLGHSGVQDLYGVKTGYNPLAAGTAVIATRNGTPFFGVGLLATVSAAEIKRHADPNDLNHDGIRGRVNWVNGFVGRFGRKAQTASLEGFVRGPLFNHLGITTDPLPQFLKAKLPVPSDAASQNGGGTLFGGIFGIVGPGLGQLQQGQAAAPEKPLVDDDGVPDPELGQQDLFDLVSWVELLAAPKPDAPTAETRAGKKTFAKIGCTGCHLPSLESPLGPLPAYTDLLIHDMGPGLADGITQGLAGPSDFRTQPLWGVSATGPYLHDGRADTLDEAIRDHGGEAKASRDRYVALSASQQQDLLAFLRSLGGHGQAADGLLPPHAEVPAVGALGGPDVALSAADAARFARGRIDFDHDATPAAGLGTEFNGDSCRACHFEPVLGGGGPLGVNDLRQGIVDASGTFTAPGAGTLLFRLTTTLDGHVAPDAQANVFELRQTPPVFGLGLVDRIPDAEILAHADPNDTNGDGIRGVAQVLPDGRLGRFGWKAQVPSLAEFVRDAETHEEGLTVPAAPGMTFGATTDTDGVPDPEVSASTLGDLTFFAEHLAPPPPRSTDPAAEAQGRKVFATVGCDACHIPTMTTADGTPVHLYSDLLLHEVAPAGATGIVNGKASMRAFRTPPLWGVSRTAPYMHDGSAETLTDAIEAHHGEADASRLAFEKLSAPDKADLLAFLKSL